MAELSLLLKLIYQYLELFLLLLGILYLFLQNKVLGFPFLLELLLDHRPYFLLEVINIIEFALPLLEIR